jgi:hypothetical protein
MVSPRTRRLIRRGVPLAAATGTSVGLLGFALMGVTLPVGPWGLNYWFIAIPTIPVAYWAAWNWGDPAHGDQRREAFRLGYNTYQHGIRKR